MENDPMPKGIFFTHFNLQETAAKYGEICMTENSLLGKEGTLETELRLASSAFHPFLSGTGSFKITKLSRQSSNLCLPEH